MSSSGQSKKSGGGQVSGILYGETRCLSNGRRSGSALDWHYWRRRVGRARCRLSSDYVVGNALMLLDIGRETDYMPHQSGTGRNDRIVGALPWFVLQTEPQSEFQAFNRTSEIPGVKPWLVLEVRSRVLLRHGRPLFIGHDKAREEVLRPFFPGYLLVSFDPSGEAYAPLLRWNRELRTRKLLCDTAYNPLALPEGVVESLQHQGRAGDGAIDLSRPVPVLSVGDQVTVREGPFADRKAVVEWTDQQRVQVLIGMLRVTVRRGQVV